MSWYPNSRPMVDEAAVRRLVDDAAPDVASAALVRLVEATGGNPLLLKQRFTQPKLALRDQLGIMGHTGEGLNQVRAHLHLELNLMLSRHFESWHDTFFKNDPNRHGLYNGLNLAGFDYDAAENIRENRRRFIDTLGGGFATLACLCVDTASGALHSRYCSGGRGSPTSASGGAASWSRCHPPGVAA